MLFVYEDPEHWRDRAEEARATASYVRDPEVKITMLRIADEYDRLTRLIDERRAKSTGPQPDARAGLP
jgi:hypothetical protein